MIANLHEVLTVIEELHAHGHYSGCVSRFFKLIELCASKRPVSICYYLRTFKLIELGAAKRPVSICYYLRTFKVIELCAAKRPVSI
jgi:hypothetical protein